MSQEDADEMPVPFDKPENQVVYVANLNRQPIQTSQMFLISNGLDRFSERYPDSAAYNLSQGDGGMSLPGLTVETELFPPLKAFLPAKHSTAYAKHPHGDIRLRRALHRFYGFTDESGKSGLPGVEDVIITDGGREAIYRWLTSITPGIGEFVVTAAAPWPTYGQVVRWANKNLLRAPGRPEQGFDLTEEGLEACVRYANKQRRPIAGLVITSPGNPTGRYLTEEQIKQLTELAVKLSIGHVYWDLIYMMVLTPDAPRYNLRRMFEGLSDEARIATTAMHGEAKCLGASNLRCAHNVVGSKSLASVMRAVPSHVAMPSPDGQSTALDFYGSADPWNDPRLLRVTIPINNSRLMAKEMLRKRGFRFMGDQGYYLFVNVADWIDGVKIKDVKALSIYLSENFGVAIVPGGDFCQPDWVRISIAVEPEYIHQGLLRFFAGLDSLK